MSRSMKVLSLMALAVLVVAQATPLSAGPPNHAGYQFGAATAPGTLDMSVRLSNPNIVVKTNPGFTVFPAPPDTAEDVADDAATALCLAADAHPAIACVGAPAACFVWAGPAGGSVTCNTVPAGGGFTITQPGGGNSNFYLSLVGTSQVRDKDGLQSVRGGGDAGTISADLLASHNLRLVPNGINGIVTFNTPGAPGGSGTNPFTVSTTGKTDLQLHTEICDKYAAIGVPTILHTPPDTADFIDTANVVGGYSIESFNPPTVLLFDVTPVAGQTVVSQVSGANTTTASSVPALSEWGMVVLIVALVLSGIWMIRRRQKLQST